MAQFRATIKGQRGEASRLGSKNSGLSTTTDGWNIGASAWLHHEAGDKEDVLEIGITGGSHDREAMVTIRIKESDLDDGKKLAAALRAAADQAYPFPEVR